MGKRGRVPVIYTPERAQEVRRRVRENGERVTAVCQDLGMNYENFLRWCRRNHFNVHSAASRSQARRRARGHYSIGEKVAPLRNFRPGSKASAIVEDWKAGTLSPQEIAEKNEVSYVYTLRVRKLSGLNPPAGKGRNIRNSSSLKNQAKEERKRLIQLELDRGRSASDLAQKFGVSRQRIYQIKQDRSA